MTQDELDQILRDAFDVWEAGNLKDAVRLYKRAARQGSNAARSNLGTIFDDVFVPSNPAKAVYWYKQGVQNGYGNCAWNLAMHYAGLGRRRGYLYWLRVADEMGEEDASAELADGYWWTKRNADRLRAEATGRENAPF